MITRCLARASALAALVVAIGCGGGGGGGGTDRRYSGAYSGPFSVSLRGTMPDGFAPPLSGTAVATVTREGLLTVFWGGPYVVTGTISKSGAVSAAQLTYESPSGPQTLSALVGWGGEEGKRKVTAIITLESPTGTAVLNALLTRLP